MIKDFQTFVIHYSKLTERKQKLEMRLNEIGLDYLFVSDIDRDKLSPEQQSKFVGNLKNSYKANFLSHIKCYELILNSANNLGLVLEDDSIPNENFLKMLKKYQKISPEDFDLFFVSPGKNNFHIPLYLRRPFKYVYEKGPEQTNWGGHGGSRNADAYFISERCAEILVSKFSEKSFKTDTTIDWWLNELIMKNNLKVFWAEPTIVSTNHFESSF